MTIHHIGIITKDIQKSILQYEKLGYTCLGETTLDYIQNNIVTFLSSPDNKQKIELISPANRNSTIVNFPAGYHHICYDICDDPNYLSQFKKLKIGKVFTQPTIAPAIENRKIVFALLQDGTFVEFIISK